MITKSLSSNMHVPCLVWNNIIFTIYYSKILEANMFAFAYIEISPRQMQTI